MSVTFRGMRRLDAALSNDPLVSFAATENLLGSRAKLAKDFLSRKERKERKEMEGGNGMSKANEVTLCSKDEIPNCRRKPHAKSAK